MWSSACPATPAPRTSARPPASSCRRHPAHQRGSRLPRCHRPEPGGDEFWYLCVPDDPRRSSPKLRQHWLPRNRGHHRRHPRRRRPRLSLDLYRRHRSLSLGPIPGVQTLNFKPFRVDLSPFAGLLSDGQSHTVALSVFNADNYFIVTANLLVFTIKAPAR